MAELMEKSEKSESRESRNPLMVRVVRSPFSKFSTTFPEDYAIANAFGADAVRDTYRRCAEWKSDVRYWAELVITLNTYCWYFYERGDIELSRLYAELYHDANYWALMNYDGDDGVYYFNATD